MNRKIVMAFTMALLIVAVPLSIAVNAKEPTALSYKPIKRFTIYIVGMEFDERVGKLTSVATDKVASVSKVTRVATDRFAIGVPVAVSDVKKYSIGVLYRTVDGETTKYKVFPSLSNKGITGKITTYSGEKVGSFEFTRMLRGTNTLSGNTVYYAGTITIDGETHKFIGKEVKRIYKKPVPRPRVVPVHPRISVVPIPEPSADLNGDGVVDNKDLQILLGFWGPYTEGEFNSPDINGDGTVGVPDLLAVLSNWGTCDGDCPADLNGDQEVNKQDINIVQAFWGMENPILANSPDLNDDGMVNSQDLLILLGSWTQ